MGVELGRLTIEHCPSYDHFHSMTQQLRVTIEAGDELSTDLYLILFVLDRVLALLSPFNKAKLGEPQL